MKHKPYTMNHQKVLKELAEKQPKNINGRAIYLRKIREEEVNRKIAVLQKAKNDYKTLFRYEHLKMVRSSLK